MTETAASKTGWKKAAFHTATLPSGTTVELKLPNLPEMVKTGEFPNPLLPIALKQITEEDVDAEQVGKLAEYHRFLVSTMVVKPSVEPDEVGQLPAEDVDMLLAFANRERDTDAVGHQLAGLETHEGFRKFRGLDRSNEDLLGL